MVCLVTNLLILVFATSASVSQLIIPIASPHLTGSIVLTELTNGVKFTFNINLVIPVSELKWSIHTIPIELGPDYLEKCHVAAKSDSIFPAATLNTPVKNINQSVENIQLTELIGNSLVIRRSNGTLLSCTNILDSDYRSSNSNTSVDIFKAIFHGPKVKGAVYVMVLSDRLKIYNQLTAMETNEPKVLAWSLAQKWWQSDTGASLKMCKKRENLLHPHSSKDSLFVIGEKQVITIRIDATLFDLARSAVVLFSSEGTSYNVYECASLIPIRLQLATTQLAKKSYIFTQYSPFHSTYVSPPLSNSVGQWQIHSKPVNACRLLSFQKSQPITIDSYISLANQNGEYLPQVTLFGLETALLSSLTYRTVSDGSFDCAVIHGLSNRTVEAEFLHPIVGKLNFADIGDGTTMVFGTLRHMFDVKTSQADWSIRKGHSGSTLTELTCKPEKLLFNPTKVTKGCNSNSTFCPIGALTEKYGKITILPYNTTYDDYITVKIVTDDLPLFGPHSIIGNTLSVNLGWSYGCTNISLSQHKMLEAQLKRYGPSRSPQIGLFSVDESIDWESVASLIFSVNFDRKDSLTFAIHENPIDLSLTQSHPCGWHSVGPIWKSGMDILTTSNWPFQRSNDTIILKPILDTVQSIGDKGIGHFMGKSVVLSSKGQLICGSLLPKMKTMTAVAEFDASWIKGFVKIIQSDVSSDHITPSTHAVIIVDLKSNVTKVEWMINSANITELQKNSCQSLRSPPYNPFYLAIKNPQMPQICQKEWRLCALGDLSNKAGQLITGRRTTITVPMLPITGPYSIVDQVMKLVNPTNSTQQACSTIRLWHSYQIVVTVNKNMSRRQVQQTLSLALSMKLHQIEVSYNSTLYGRRCIKFDVNLQESEPVIKMVKTELMSLDMGQLFNSTNCTLGSLDNPPSSGCFIKSPYITTILLLLLIVIWMTL